MSIVVTESIYLTSLMLSLPALETQLKFLQPPHGFNVDAIATTCSFCEEAHVSYRIAYGVNSLTLRVKRKKIQETTVPQINLDLI